MKTFFSKLTMNDNNNEHCLVYKFCLKTLSWKTGYLHIIVIMCVVINI